MKEHYYSNFKGCLSDPAGLGLLGRVRPDGSLASILAPPSVSPISPPPPLALRHDARPLKFQIRRLTGLSTRLVVLRYLFVSLPPSLPPPLRLSPSLYAKRCVTPRFEAPSRNT